MKYISILCVILTALILCSWSFFKPSSGTTAEKVFNEIVKKIEKKYCMQALIVEGSWNSCDEKEKLIGKKYDEISFTYISRNISLTVEEARGLFISIIGDFLSELNAHAKQISGVVQCPITPENLSLTICFEAFESCHVYAPYVRAVCLVSGKIVYYSGVCTQDKQNVEETFDEAKAILEKEKKAAEEHTPTASTPSTT